MTIGECRAAGTPGIYRTDQGFVVATHLVAEWEAHMATTHPGFCLDGLAALYFWAGALPDGTVLSRSPETGYRDGHAHGVRLVVRDGSAYTEAFRVWPDGAVTHGEIKPLDAWPV